MAPREVESTSQDFLHEIRMGIQNFKLHFTSKHNSQMVTPPLPPPLPPPPPSYNTPCAACKLLRRKCASCCAFAPHFPADQPHKFSYVHRVFGASNVSKILQDLPPHYRQEAADSLIYEAEQRLRDPVYGCVGNICLLNQHLEQIRHHLSLAKAELCSSYDQEGIVEKLLRQSGRISTDRELNFPFLSEKV
ncbi:LOB domain-containing protein 10 [Acorus gramineus]|uniref:LOB domain-containing protein 10 n=1 Tax=Acorus gramineus TaxID=55184 RepID=A0AAV9A410_ACOGR|nr:LOB domain-containing protein 10 [Acorus gramineus]